MRWIFILLALCLLAPHAVLAEWTLQDRHPLPAPSGLEFTECSIKNETNYATLWVVTFNPKTHDFAVMDNPQGAYDLGTAAEKRGALAAVNGGYFQPDHTPLGLLIRQGAEIHPLEHASLLSGILSVTPAAITIQRTAAFKSSPTIREALQAGPFLVDHGSPTNGLNGTKDAARTVVFQDAKGHFGILVAKSTSLAGMAEILATPIIFPEGRIVRALNLDGGTSTALWVRSSPPFYAHEWKGVRDYLAIVPR